MYVLTSSSLTALMSRDLFHEAKNTFWSGYLVAMARWKGCANRFVNHGELKYHTLEPTLMPHSGTRSRLLKTTTRSQT